MRKLRKLMALMLVFCMMSALGVWSTGAYADWYTVQFTKVENKDFAGVPTGTDIAPAEAENKPAGTAADPAGGSPAGTSGGAKTDAEKPGKLEWFYNPWAGTLVIRGRGGMPGFDEKHPAPWHTECKRALRVIIDEGVTTISSEAFKDFENLQSVVFPSTLKQIAKSAFEKCEKLKRIEVVTEIEDAEKLIKESGSEELLKTDKDGKRVVKIVHVTKEAVRRELCWLTTYCLDRVEVYRDKAGRPVRIIEHKCDGSTVDTGIQYLNEATVDNKAKSEDAAERSYAVTTTAKNEKSAKEKEVNEYGQTLVKGSYDLNSAGRQVKGTEVTENDDSVTKRTLDKATYYSDGSGRKEWTSVTTYDSSSYFYLEEITETVDAKDRILSVNVKKYDRNGILVRQSEKNNTYGAYGIESSVYTESDGAGVVTNTTNTYYDYNPETRKMTGKTVEEKIGNYTETTTSEFGYDEKGNLAKVTETNDATSTVTETQYSYTDKGLKAEKEVVKTYADGSTETTSITYDKNERVKEEVVISADGDGKIERTEETEYKYNAEHVVSESTTVTTTETETTTTVKKYDADGREIKEVQTAVDGESGDLLSQHTETTSYDADGRIKSNKTENTDSEGNTTVSQASYKYDSMGKPLEEKGNIVFSDGTTNSYDNDYRYDSNDRIKEESREQTGSSFGESSSSTAYSYKEDGSYTETGEYNNTAGTGTFTNEYNSKGEWVDGESTFTPAEGAEEAGSGAVLMSRLAGGEETGEEATETEAADADVDPCADGHSYELTDSKDASCTEAGYKVYTCSACGDSYTDEIAAAHRYELTDSKEATCTEAGHRTYTCSACGDSYTEVIDAKGHSYGGATVTKEATCSEVGSQTSVCSLCGASIDSEIPKKAHSFGAVTVTKEPTETETGAGTHACTACGASEPVVIPVKTPAEGS